MPLHQMAMTRVFQWTSVHQKAWKAILLLASLAFALNVIDKNKPLLLAPDSSQISISWVLFYIINANIKLIALDSKILKGADRKKAAAIRKAIRAIFCLMSYEETIKIIHHKFCYYRLHWIIKNSEKQR